MATGIVVCWFVTRGAWAATGIVVCWFVTRGAWAATGIVVCWFVCLFVCLSVCHEYIYSPGCHSTAFTAWIAFTQQYLGLNSDRL